MNSIITENAIAEYLSDVIGSIQTITGSSTEDRTTPSVRIVCQSCQLPEGFTTDIRERSVQLAIAVVYNADDSGSSASSKTLWEAIAAKMNLAPSVVVEIGGWETLIHNAFLQDQMTENEDSLLVYAGIYQMNLAFHEST